MPTESRVAAVIPARWASSRFPGKPLAEICGKPMILWVMERAQQAGLVNEVVVATDDRRIFDTVTDSGGKAVMTSPSHPSGTDRVAEAVADSDCDVVVNVQGDEPLIPPANIDLAVRPLLEDPEVRVATLMIRIDDPGSVFDPDVTKVVVGPKGYALYFSRAPIPFHRDEWSGTLAQGTGEMPAMDRSRVYQHIGLYAYRKSFLMQFPRLAVSELEKVEKLEQLRILENGIGIKVVETRSPSIGVDRPEDLRKVERFLGNPVPRPQSNHL